MWDGKNYFYDTCLSIENANEYSDQSYPDACRRSTNPIQTIYFLFVSTAETPCCSLKIKNTLWNYLLKCVSINGCLHKQPFICYSALMFYLSVRRRVLQDASIVCILHSLITCTPVLIKKHTKTQKRSTQNRSPKYKIADWSSKSRN